MHQPWIGLVLLGFQCLILVVSIWLQGTAIQHRTEALRFYERGRKHFEDAQQLLAEVDRELAEWRSETPPLLQ